GKLEGVEVHASDERRVGIDRGLWCRAGSARQEDERADERRARSRARKDHVGPLPVRELEPCTEHAVQSSCRDRRERVRSPRRTWAHRREEGEGFTAGDAGKKAGVIEFDSCPSPCPILRRA